MHHVAIAIGTELGDGEVNLSTRTFHFCPIIDGDFTNPLHQVEAAFSYLRDNARIGDDVITPILEAQGELNA